MTEAEKEEAPKEHSGERATLEVEGSEVLEEGVDDMAEGGEEEELDDDSCLEYAEILEIDLHPNYLEKTDANATQPDVPMVHLDSDKEDGKPGQESKGTHKDSPNSINTVVQSCTFTVFVKVSSSPICRTLHRSLTFLQNFSSLWRDRQKMK